MMLTRQSGLRSSVSLSRNAAGDTSIDVTVRVGDEGAETVEDAARIARDHYAALTVLYPPAPEHDGSSVTLTRNAKGETQVAVELKATGHGASTLDAAAAQAVGAYDQLRAKYPMANGLTAKPGSVA
jgi:hypothetical protein